MEKIIVCERVYKVYPGRVDAVAVSNVSLEVKKGELVTITGSNGSGKSTLLKCIAGILETTSGRIIVNGKLLGSLKEQELAQYKNRTIGFIFQQDGLVDFLSVRENIAIPLLIANAENIDEKVEEMTTKLGISHLLDEKVSSLSGGEKKKVEIAVRNILHGMPVTNRDALINPDSLDFFEKIKDEL